MDQRTFEQKVRELAEKLKKQGIATSDAQAKMMAESILQTERRQADAFTKKQFDPAMNPQQRVPAAAPARQRPEQLMEDVDRAQQPSEQTGPAEQVIAPPAGPVGTVEGVDQSRPISELLSEGGDEPVEESVITESGEQVAMQPEQQASVPPPQQFPPDHADGAIAAPQRDDVTQESAPQARPQTPEQPRETQLPPQQPTPPPQTAQGVADQPVAVPAPEPEPQPEKKDDQPKIDLTEMFNFSKRK